MTVTLDLRAAPSDPSTRRTLTALSTSLAKSKRVVVVTGAGISCSCGIPDFRSSDGLYALVKAKYPHAVLKGRDLFDVSLFRDATSTALFYTFMAELKTAIDAATPSPTHHFLKTLDAKGKLLRSYTQNIDGLEERAGLAGSSSESVRSSGKGKSKLKAKDVRNVQLHGDIHRVRCVLCAAEFTCTPTHLASFRDGTPPDCPECQARSSARVARAARPLKIGTLRPCIVLYDEPHPLGDDIGALESADLARKPDMLVVMGTSLKVHGLKRLVRDFAHVVHEGKGEGKVVFVNRTPPPAEWVGVFDYWVCGETDAWVGRVLDEWRRARPQDWEVQTTLKGADGLKVVKQPAAKTKGSKKKDPNAENVPPTTVPLSPPTTSLPSPPLSPSKIPIPLSPSTRPTPLSPSKRTANASHYDDVESSPSKRRGALTKRPAVPDAERRMLFAVPTPSPTPTPTPMQVVEVVISKSARMTSATSKPARNVTSKPARVTSASKPKAKTKKGVPGPVLRDVGENQCDVDGGNGNGSVERPIVVE